MCRILVLLFILAGCSGSNNVSINTNSKSKGDKKTNSKSTKSLKHIWGDVRIQHFGFVENNVTQIDTTFVSAAALKDDGSVVTWGLWLGGIPVEVVDKLSSGVTKLYANRDSYAALKSDGSVVTWGSYYGGGSQIAFKTSGEVDISSFLTSGVVKIFPGFQVFAALKNDGTVVSWGGAFDQTSDSESVDTDLVNVVDIVSNYQAYAALKADGSVVCWGADSVGGDCSGVDFSSGVKKIISDEQNNFFAFKNNNTVVGWGDIGIMPEVSDVKKIDYLSGQSVIYLKNDGSIGVWDASGNLPDLSSVAADIASGVVDLQVKLASVAFLKTDGRVITWLNPGSWRNMLPQTVGAELSSDITKFVNFTNSEEADYYNSFRDCFSVEKSTGELVLWGYDGMCDRVISTGSPLIVSSTKFAGDHYLVSLANGDLVTWLGDYNGNAIAYTEYLVYAQDVIDKIKNVVDIKSSAYAHVVLTQDQSVYSMGDALVGGALPGLTTSDVSDVVKVVSTPELMNSAGANIFFGITNQGRVKKWYLDGALANVVDNYGQDFSAVESELVDVVDIVTGPAANAALTSKGKVIAWGHPDYGGNTTAVTASLANGCEKIYNNGYAFAVIKTDGSVVTWGDAAYGGDSSSVSADLVNIREIVPNPMGAFAAITKTGRVVTWGDATHGGDSSAAAADLLSGVESVLANPLGAYAALKSNGQVVTWGNAGVGGSSAHVAADLAQGVVKLITNNTGAFYALKDDGRVIGWTDSNNSAFIQLHDTNGPSDMSANFASSDFVDIAANANAMSGVKADGTVVTIGSGSSTGATGEWIYSGLYYDRNPMLTDVKKVYGASGAMDGFAALKNNGDVVVYGHSGICPANIIGKNIVKIHQTKMSIIGEDAKGFLYPICGGAHGALKKLNANEIEIKLDERFFYIFR